MSFFGDVDALLAKHRADRIEVKVTAREFDYSGVKCATSGVWSARRASVHPNPQGLELHERSATDLIEKMKADGGGKAWRKAPMPTDPKELEKRRKREAAYQESLKRLRERLAEKDRAEDAKRPGGDPNHPRKRRVA